MKKQLLKVTGEFEQGVFIPSGIKLTKKILSHPKNKNVALTAGWYSFDDECPNGCPSDTDEGRYRCIGGNCVFIPNP